MPTNGQVVKIAHYTRSKFNSLTTKDNATIYYVEEPNGEIKQYIGNTHVVSDKTISYSEITGSKPPVGATTNTGTVTNVSSGSQVSGLTLLVNNGTSTPTITTSISNEANFRAAIGAGTSNLKIGTTSSTAKAGNYQPSYADITGSKPPVNATVNEGTVTNVSAGTTQIPGMTMLISNGASTPTITTSISNEADFRSAIGAAPSSHTHSQYLTSFTETDPTVPEHVKDITTGNISSWNSKQNAITGGASTITVSDLIANSALISTSSGKVSVSAVTSTELGRLSGVTSNVQTQLNGKSGTGHTHSAATTSAAGFMSSTDKTRLDVLHSLLEEDTSNNVVDSINEVLAVFNNYPEGADLVTALSGKVDKVSGKGLSTNDFTTTEKNKLSGIATNATANTGTVTNVSSGTQISGMTMTVANGTTTPTITTTINNAANFRTAIGAGTGTSNLKIGTTSSTAKAGDYQPTWGDVTGKPTFSAVTLSGSYNDLSNKPTIPSIPSLMTTTEGNTGTATAQRTINAANLKSIILNHSPAGARTPTTHNHDDRYYTESEMNTLLSGKAASSHSHSWSETTSKPTNIIRQVSFSNGTMTIEVL